VGRVLSVVALALVAASAALAASGPPPIKETFTLLPCPKHPVSTLELEGCAEHRIVALDRKIDAKAQAIWKKLPSAGAKAHFVAAERSWFAYRRATCLSRADLNAGGTLAVIDYASCVVDLNATHLVDLTRFLKDLSGH
jgi:uncharacterized protein YecT (DUF1311 family)